MKKDIRLHLFLSGLFLVLLFVLAGITANTYQEQIAASLGKHIILSIFVFVLIAALAVIIPIVSNIFLLPFGVVAWGPLTTSLLCILGWWIGSIVSFSVGRYAKEWVLTHYPSLQAHEFIDSLISKRYESVSLIFLRMTLPVDILSYALGLFSTRISWKQNALTTLIGITPFAFIFSYIGLFSSAVQLEIFGTTTCLFLLYIFIQKRK
jgi:uncharacterized membrane protein YdjX (TVP38/TMEM64 family)